MDSLQPLSDKADSLYTVGDEFDNKLYFSSLSSKRLTGLVDLVNLLVKVDLNGPITHFTSSTLIGEGAQFRVFKSEIVYYKDSKLVGEDFAMKQPRFFREANTALDLRTPKAQQHLHDLRLEILALCHPNLRKHPNIVKLLFWGVDTSSWHTSLYLGQELALSDLKLFLQEHSNSTELSWSIRYQLCLDVGAGLDAIHHLQIVHGDLKPENILVFDQNGLVAKLSDFGMSLCDDTQPGESLRGTPGWQAPEIHSAGALYYLDHIKADNYSFGLVIWSTMFLDGTPVSMQDFTSVKAMDEGRNQSSDPFFYSSYITMIQAIRQLLKENPDHRPDLVSDLLDDGSVLYQQWASEYPDEDTSTSGSETTTCTSISDLEIVGYDWEPPVLGGYCVKHLQNFFKDNMWLIDPPVLLTMFFDSLGDWQKKDDPKAWDQDTLLKPLVAAAILGFDPAKGLLPLLHKGLQRRFPQRFQMEWLREAVETGSWIAGAELRAMSYDTYTAAVHTFRANGGYNKFYTNSNTSIDLYGKHVQEAMDKSSTKDERDFNTCSITTFADITTVKEVLENKTTNINMPGTDGYTPLWIACARGEWPIVELLLAYGADPTITREPGGVTCLHWIFHFDEMWIDQASKALVKSGADVNAILLCNLPIFHYPFKLPAGTPLHWAVSVGQETAIKSLLDCGADPFIRNSKTQYLHNERYRAIDDPVKSRSFKSLGLSPLDLAAMEREPCIFGMLIPGIVYDKINDVDEEGCSVFHRLDSGHWGQTCSDVRYPKQLFRGNPQQVQLKLRETIHALIRLGANINQLTTPKKHSLGGQTPLMLAVQANQFETVIELLKAGADVNVRNNEGKNALFFLHCVGLSYEDEQAFEILRLLCSYSANFNCSANDGSTPILTYPRFAITDFLLGIGVEIEQRIPDRFWFATMNTLGLLLTRPTEYESEVAKVLLKHLSPIHDSLKRNNLIEQADLKGKSLLYLASQSRNLESALVLINQGAEINRIRTYMSFEGGPVKSQFSKTPLDEALRGRDSSLNILYQRKTSHFSKSELEREAKQYDKIAAILRKAGGLKASQCKDIPSYFRSSNEKKPMYELYRSKSFHSNTEHSQKYRGRRLTKEVGLIIPQFDGMNVETSKCRIPPRSWLRSNSI